MDNVRFTGTRCNNDRVMMTGSSRAKVPAHQNRRRIKTNQSHHSHMCHHRKNSLCRDRMLQPQQQKQSRRRRSNRN